MEWNANKPGLEIGVIGTGTMGRGIAQVAAQAGIMVRMLDRDPAALAQAREAIARTLGGLADKGRLSTAQRDAAVACLQPAAAVTDLKDCDIVVEAIAEDLEAKRALFASLEEVLRPDAILATNTSSLSVTAVAAKARHPGRVAGWHFFNPVPLMKIAEVVDGLATAPWASQALMDLSARLGHKAVRASDMPGFIVNHAGRAYIPEGLRLLSEGIAPFHDIDRIMRDCAGFRMGPFELIDLVGLDVGQTVMESLYNQYYQEPRFKLTPVVAQRVAAGLYGRKSGRGFYDYASGQPAPVPEAEAPAAAAAPVWVCPAEPDLAASVAAALARGGARLESGPQPSAEALIVTTPVGKDVATTCLELGLDARRAVAVDALFPLDRRVALMCSPATDGHYRDIAHAYFAAAGAAVSVLRDSPGFVAQRIVAQIVSIGCDIAQQRIAAPADIDLAVRLALGYPKGPFELGDAIGARRILAVSESLSQAYDEPRYRPSIWLRRRAMLGLPLSQAD
ncbi:MAG: 3-hydroxyacyl-CoA dehydrogenase [Noviherbaspirillum sp.]